MPQDNPFAKYSQPAQRSGIVITDPYKAANEARLQRQTDIEAGGLDVRQQSNERNAATTALSNRQALRKEYAGLPEIQAYRIAAQQTKLALSTDDSPAGDTALTYAYAKAMDPNSVVRDAENKMASNTQPWFQAAVENVKKQFNMDGAGNFSPEARAHLRQEVLRALASRKDIYEARRGEFSDYAQQNGFKPFDVVGTDDTQVYAPSFRSYGEKNGDPGNIISSIIGGAPIAPDRSPPVGGAGSPPPTAAPFGSTQGAVQIPPQMQQEQQEYLARHWGNIDPHDYVAFRINQDRKYNFSSDPDAYRRDVARFNEDAQKGAQPSQIPPIPDVQRPLSDIEQLRNDAVSNPVGAGIATGLNAGGFGLAGLLAPDQYAALRQDHPVSTTIGDIVGGAGGAGLTGLGLRSIASAVENPSVASLLAKPIAGDIAYGATYGGTTAKSEGRDPVTGALLGAGGAYLGNRVGGAIGRAFPKITGLGRDVSRLDDAVPTSQQLKDQASQLYKDAEASGLTATPDDTLALADTTSGLLSKEGRLSPSGRLTDVQPKVKEAYGLIQDYAGQPMTPTQVQTVRGVIADGRMSQDADERRVARLLLDNFDDWTDETNPDLAAGLTKARDTASRYLQGDQVAKRVELAEPGAAQYSQSGAGNAIRTQFRQLDRAITNGRAWLPPHVVDAVQDAARGNPLRNGLRWFGKFAPTGVVPTGALAAMTGAGAAAGGPAGALPGIALGAVGLWARQAEGALAKRSAEVAENAAFGGPEYLANLNAILAQAERRGGNAGAGSISAVTPTAADLIAQSLMAPSPY